MGLEAALLRADQMIADIPAPAESEAALPRWLHATGAWVEAALARQDGVPGRPHASASDALGRVIASSGTICGGGCRRAFHRSERIIFC